MNSKRSLLALRSGGSPECGSFRYGPAVGRSYPTLSSKLVRRYSVKIDLACLELHLISEVQKLGRYAARRRAASGLTKPETFDLLGFTHICGKTRGGRFWLWRVTISKSMRSKLQVAKDQLKPRGNRPISVTVLVASKHGARISRLLCRARQH